MKSLSDDINSTRFEAGQMAGKHWELNSALAYIEGDQPSSFNDLYKGYKEGSLKTRDNKSVGQLANVKEDLEKTRFKIEVQKLEIQLAAEASGHIKVASKISKWKQLL